MGRWKRVLGAAGAVLLVSACGAAAGGDEKKASGGTHGQQTATIKSSVRQPEADEVEEAHPARLTKPLLSSDVLVYSQRSLEKTAIKHITAIPGVEHVETMSMGQVYVDENEVTYAAVDPATFRRYTEPGTAQTQAIWNRVADGEIAVQPALGRKLQSKDGYLKVGNESDSPRIHVGAYAQLLNPAWARQIDAVVNQKWAGPLGMPRDNAMLVAMGSRSPQSILKRLQTYAGKHASVQILGPNLDIHALQTAVLTGGSVAQAVGSFSYRANPDGSVVPQASWVASKIRSEEMPIIGRVTCNVVMLPQLKAALSEVVADGLASKIYHYDGCYVPRFIAHDPSAGLSFHTFGTAIDLNAADNQRGTAGKMDRGVVAIFKKWGFRWGGDWHYTDPMHFELAQLKEAR